MRQLPAALVASLEEFLAGHSREGLVDIATALLEKPRARRDAAAVQEWLNRLDSFYATDLQPLDASLRRDGRPGTFVPQDERDTLFIRTRE